MNKRDLQYEKLVSCSYCLIPDQIQKADEIIIKISNPERRCEIYGEILDKLSEEKKFDDAIRILFLLKQAVDQINDQNTQDKMLTKIALGYCGIASLLENSEEKTIDVLTKAENLICKITKKSKQCKIYISLANEYYMASQHFKYLKYASISTEMENKATDICKNIDEKDVQLKLNAAILSLHKIRDSIERKKLQDFFV